MGQRCPLYLCVAGVEANDLAQWDSASERWLWRNLPSSSGSARVLSMKTTPIMVSDFRGSDATKTSFIPLRSWRRAPQPSAIRSRIGAVVVEEFVIEFWARRTLFSPETSWIIAFWEWILYRWIAGIEPRNLQVSDSGSTMWLWWSVAAVAPAYGYWVLWWKECCVASSLRLSAEKPPGTRESYAYHSLSDWSELAFSLIQRWYSENRTVSASLPVTRPRGL